MGAFEQKGQEHVAEIDKQIKDLRYEPLDLDWGHDCDCEYCDINPDPDPNTPARAEEIRGEIKELERDKLRVVEHCGL